MTAALESLLVALLVAGSALISAWRLLSPSLRLRVLDFAGPVLGRFCGGWLARARGRAAGRGAGGCGSCARGPGAPGRAARHVRAGGAGRAPGGSCLAAGTRAGARPA